MRLERLTRTSRYLVPLAGLCLALGLSGCAEEDDDGGGVGTGSGDGGGDGTGGDDGTGDGGDDGTGTGDGGTGTGDDGTGTGDDGSGTGDGGDEPPTCDEPANGVHEGTIRLEGNDPDTSVLDGISEITGALFVDGTNLTNLDFLICLTTVGNGLNIHDNDSLTDLDGLGGLTYLAGDLTIAENDVLARLGAPSQITTVESLTINNNAALENLTGLGGLETTNENLTIRYNDSLTSVTGLSSLAHVVTRFNVVHNPELPCSNVASLGDQLEEAPTDGAVWCDGNKDCDLLPACQ